MEIDKIIQLIDKVSTASISKISIEEGSLKISIEKNNGEINTVTEPVQLVPQTVQVSQVSTLTETAAPVVSAAPMVAAPAADDEAVEIIASPIVGTFYASPSPDAEPYVKVGDFVRKGQIVGIVEAMKLMNEIESEVEGTVTEVLVENAGAVEFGQPLFKIK